MLQFYALAFCFLALNGAVFAQFKCFDGSEAFEVADNNVLVKLYKNSVDQLPPGNNGKEKMKRLMCDLIDQDIVIGAALDKPDQQAQTSSFHRPMIRPALREEYKLLLKAVDQLDKPTALLLHNLRNGIGTLKAAIATGSAVKSAEFEAIGAILKQSLQALAHRWQIPFKAQQIVVPMKNASKMGRQPADLLMEMAKVWAEHKRQNLHYWHNGGKKSNQKCNYVNDQNGKRMLQLIIDLSTENGPKRIRRRRKKRRGDDDDDAVFSAKLTKKIAIICIVGMLVCMLNIGLFCWWNCCRKGPLTDDKKWPSSPPAALGEPVAGQLASSVHKDDTNEGDQRALQQQQDHAIYLV